MITKHTSAIIIKNASIARKLIDRSIAIINKFETCENARHVETRIKFSISNIINDKSKRKESKES